MRVMRIDDEGKHHVWHCGISKFQHDEHNMVTSLGAADCDELGYQCRLQSRVVARGRRRA